MLRLGSAEIEALVQQMHDLPDDDGGVASRLRYFQRLRFPEGANTGRGVPASFELEQIVQMLVAFELVTAGVAPMRVVRTLRTNWPRLRTSIRSGWLAALGRRPWRERELLMLEPLGLADASRPEDAYVPVENPLVPIPALSLKGWSEGERGDGPPRLVLVDPGRLMKLVREHLAVVTAFTAEDLDSEMERYAA